MPTLKQPAWRTGRSSGDKIMRRAAATIFPLPEHPDPQELGGRLRGYVEALEAVGYPLTDTNEGDQK